MDEKGKVLIIDNAPDRKRRITALKNHGYRVYPALRIAEARNRCKPGSYDVIVVNSAEDQAAAIELYDAILRLAPKQNVLLMMAPGAPPPDRDYLVSTDPEELAAKVESLIGGNPMDSEAALAA
jgi:DNA-binding NtrC family response regulator